jgi:hypothetical protein
MLKFEKRKFGVPIYGRPISSGIEPTPALTYIRRTQRIREKDEIEAKELDKRLARVFGEESSWEQRFNFKYPQDSIMMSDDTTFYSRSPTRRALDESWSERERVRLIGYSNDLESLNIELRSMIDKLRAKLVEQDEVIGKLISGNSSGKKVSIC